MENIFSDFRNVFPHKGVSFTKVIESNIVAFIKTKILRPILSMKNTPFKNDSLYDIMQCKICFYVALKKTNFQNPTTQSFLMIPQKDFFLEFISPHQVCVFQVTATLSLIGQVLFALYKKKLSNLNVSL